MARQEFVEGDRARKIKRLFLGVFLVVQPISYRILTEARYEGQGLSPIYVRFTTIGDVISLLYFVLMMVLGIWSLIRPNRVGQMRAGLIAILGLVILWLESGVRNFEPSEFSPVAAVILVMLMCLHLSLVVTRSELERTRIRRVLVVGKNTIVTSATLLVFAFIFGFTFASYTDVREISEFYPDAGVVFGAAVWSGKGLGDRPSPTLRERIDVGYDLLLRNAIPRIVVTGSSAPGELTEAEVARREYRKKGVEDSKIIIEHGSHSTLEQVQYLRSELHDKQGWQRYVIISDHYHLARVVEMCKFNGLTAIGSPSNLKQPFYDILYYRFRESVALVVYWLLGK